ncbi:MAG: hypothetical protein IBX63_11365, partial [Coriobacteriia bacterium]|nr:hypothetical protein [Coriobacteriia bacterium]
MDFGGREAIEDALKAVATQLEIRGQGHFELVVIGGAALIVLGLLDRPTRDVDVLAVGEADDDGGVVFVKSDPLPDALSDAAAAAARDFGLEPSWLNSGPADLLDHGLPPGFFGRMTSVRYGPRLVVHVPAREDLVPLKVYAAADSGVGRHTGDLAALA